MTDTMKVSIIIPVYNSLYLEDCIQSCLDQTLGSDSLEIIIIDDKSTDDTVARVSEMAHQYPLTLIQLPENSGPAAARNAGMKQATGEYIAFLDSDDMMVPEKLHKQLNYCIENPEIEAVISGIEEIDAGGATIRHLVRLFSENREEQVKIIFLDNLHTITSTLLFKRSLLDASGLMDPTLKNLEDMDFALRLLQHARMHYLPECLTIRRLLSSGLSHSASEQLFMDSRQRFLEQAVTLHTFLEPDVRQYWLLNYSRLGRVLQRQGQVKRARYYYLLSLKQGLNMVGLLGYILSFGPVGVQQKLAGNVWRNN